MLNSLNEVRLIDKNKILGEGAYSEVLKVQYAKDQRLYALKQIDISHLSKEDCNNLKNEMKLHQSLNHVHIIKFYDALQLKHMVYFLLEYACNGCLFFYIHPKKGLPERLALRFLYQTALAVKYLHENQCLHRDIKPENILLDENFNVKLCDFGWSCFLDNKKPRKSICGTYEYMPPEVIKKNAQTEKVDIWCLGIMMYEMLHGKTPFDAEDLSEIKEQLEQKQILVKESISRHCKDLLRNLLRKKEAERYDIDQVLNHEAFKGIKNYQQKQISTEDFSILMDYYLVNVRSQKRHLPESIERSMKREEENKINSNLIKEIKESFFQTANNVEGFFDNLPNVKNSVQATQDFFDVSNRNIPAQTYIEQQKIESNKQMPVKNFGEQKQIESNRQIQYIQSVQNNNENNKSKQNIISIQSHQQVDFIKQDSIPQKFNFSKLYKNIQQKSSGKKQDVQSRTNSHTQVNLNTQHQPNDAIHNNNNQESINQQNRNLSLKTKKNSQQQELKVSKTFQSNRYYIQHPINFQNSQEKNQIRNKSQSFYQDNDNQSKYIQSRFANPQQDTTYRQNPPQRLKDQLKIDVQQQTETREKSQENLSQSFNGNISQYIDNRNNSVLYQKQSVPYRENSPQIIKKVEKQSQPNTMIKSMNSPDYKKRTNFGQSKSFYGSSANFQPMRFSKGFELPLNENKMQRENNKVFQPIQNQVSTPRDIKPIKEEDIIPDKSYKNMNFINASYRSINTQNDKAKTESQSLNKQTFISKNSITDKSNMVKKSIPESDQNNNIQQQIKYKSFKMALPTHKYVWQNGVLQKTELTEQDLKEHGPKLAKNYSGVMFQKQLRSFSTDMTKTKILAPNANKIANFNLDLQINKMVQNDQQIQQQKSLTSRESLNKDVTLFRDQIFRRNITIVKKLTQDR